MTTAALPLASDTGKASPRIRGLSIPQRLSLIVLVVAIPMLLLLAASVWRMSSHEREQSREVLMYSAHALTDATDALLSRYASVAQLLASTPSLARDDMSVFRTVVERSSQVLANAAIVLFTPDGQGIVNTLARPDTPLPRVPAEALAAADRAFETGQMQIASITIGPFTTTPVVGVIVPVFRARKPAYALAIVIHTTEFLELLNTQEIPAGWLTAIADRNGRVVARSLDHESRAGQPAEVGWRATLNQNGFFQIVSKGKPYTLASAVSPLSGWTVGVAVTTETLEAPIRQTIMMSSLVGLGVTLSCFLFAAWAARRITTPIKTLTRGAIALRHHQPVSLAPTQVPEIDRVLQAFDAASQELRAHEERRAKAQKALEASEERFRLFVDLAPASIAMFDRDMRYLAASRRWIAQFCPDEPYVVGRTHYEVFPRLSDTWRAKFQRATAGEILSAEDDPNPHTDGRMRWVTWEIMPWRAPDGEIGGIVMFADDVTSRHEVVAALKDSEIRYERLANATNEGVLIYDDQRIIEANASFLRMFDCSKDEVGRTALDQFFPPDSREQAIALMGLDDARSRETAGLRRGGATFPIEVSGALIRHGGRDMRVGIVRDLTEQKRAEEERRMLQTKLLHASRLSEIGQMAAALAHELNQPLTAVTSYIGGCRRLVGADLTDPARKQKLLDVMALVNAEALRAGEIIRRLREFVGTGQTERRVEKADAVIREASTLAIADAKHNGVSIRFDIGDPGSILVNKVQIQQVIVNLVRNAIEAMETTERRELTIGLATRGDWAELSVSDTGSGLSPEMNDRLFKPFSSTKSHGMGIGLSVCREIVEAHDGKISAAPNPAGGMVFRFTLPLVRNGEMSG